MGSNISIGQYIQFLRKQNHLSQKELAEKIGVSFQAVSKWETGENLPDAGILLELADILNTTTDKILSAGNLVLRKTKRISIADIKEGFTALENLKSFFGEQSIFYRGAIEGINNKMHIDIESYLMDEKGREHLLAEAVIQYISNGYIVDVEEIKEHFPTLKIREKIKRYMSDGALFDTKSKNYVDYRPVFPQAAVDLIFSIVPEPVMADIGSGTGRLSGRCLSRSAKLYAVEPNAQMRRAAEDQFSEHANYQSVAAFAQQTSLPEKCLDVITVASAYHYFDNDATRKEFRRILKSDGYVFLFWDVYTGNIYDEEKAKIDQKYRTHLSYGHAHESRAESLFGKNKYQTKVFENIIYQTYEAFLGGWSSASYIPHMGTSEYTKFEKEARTLFDRFAKNGLIELKVTTLCFYGQLT